MQLDLLLATHTNGDDGVVRLPMLDNPERPWRGVVCTNTVVRARCLHGLSHRPTLRPRLGSGIGCGQVRDWANLVGSGRKCVQLRWAHEC